MSDRPWDPGPVVPVPAPEPLPQRREAVERGLWVPAGRAFLIAGPLSVVAFLVLVINGGDDLIATIAPALIWAVSFWCVTFVVAFILALFLTSNPVIWWLELRLRTDINGDNSLGPPGARERRVVVEIVQDGQPLVQAEIRRVSAKSVMKVAQSVLSGRSTLSQRQLESKAKLGGTEARKLREELEEFGYAKRQNPMISNSELELTPRGHGMFHGYLGKPCGDWCVWRGVCGTVTKTHDVEEGGEGDE